MPLRSCRWAAQKSSLHASISLARQGLRAIGSHAGRSGVPLGSPRLLPGFFGIMGGFHKQETGSS